MNAIVVAQYEMLAGVDIMSGGMNLHSLHFSVGMEMVRSSRVIESQLADFLVFLRRILSLRVTKRVSAFIKWIDPLMTIISHKCSSGKG